MPPPNRNTQNQAGFKRFQRQIPHNGNYNNFTIVLHLALIAGIPIYTH